MIFEAFWSGPQMGLAGARVKWPDGNGFAVWRVCSPDHRANIIRSTAEKDALMWKNISRNSVAVVGGALMALSVSALAQTEAEKPVTGQARAQAEQVSTARLNAEQAAKAKWEAEAYQARINAAQASVAQEQAEFGAETASYEQQKAAIAEKAARERLQWEADVNACQAGDKSRCAPTPKSGD